MRSTFRRTFRKNLPQAAGRLWSVSLFCVGSAENLLSSVRARGDLLLGRIVCVLTNVRTFVTNYEVGQLVVSKLIRDCQSWCSDLLHEATCVTQVIFTNKV